MPACAHAGHGALAEQRTRVNVLLELLGRSGVGVEPPAPSSVRQGAGGGRDDRATTGRRFDGRKTKPFHQRREHQRRRPIQQYDEFVVGQEAREDDPSGKGRGRGPVPGACRLGCRRLLARTHRPEPAAGRRVRQARQLLEDFQELFEVFMGTKPPDVHEGPTRPCKPSSASRGVISGRSKRRKIGSLAQPTTWIRSGARVKLD